jgi:hypothetical protein
VNVDIESLRLQLSQSAFYVAYRTRCACRYHRIHTDYSVYQTNADRLGPSLHSGQCFSSLSIRLRMAVPIRTVLQQTQSACGFMSPLFPEGQRIKHLSHHPGQHFAFLDLSLLPKNSGFTVCPLPHISTHTLDFVCSMVGEAGFEPAITYHDEADPDLRILLGYEIAFIA